MGVFSELLCGMLQRHRNFNLSARKNNFGSKNKIQQIMKKIIALTTIILAIVVISCRTTHNNSNKNTMDKEKIKSEIIQAETNLITLYKQGEFMKALSIDLNSPDFRCIKNGKIETYEALETRYKKTVDEKRLKSMDYKVESRDFNFINADNVLVTLSITLNITMSDGNLSTQGPIAETILWQRIENNWRLGYYHASELPKGN